MTRLVSPYACRATVGELRQASDWPKRRGTYGSEERRTSQQQAFTPPPVVPTLLAREKLRLRLDIPPVFDRFSQNCKSRAL